MKFFNLDTDTTLGGANASDNIVASQKAIKIYIDNNSGGGGASNTGFTAVNPVLTPVSGVCTWTITHNLNSIYVVCTLYSGSIEIQKNVSIDSANQITISFNAISEVAAGSCTAVILVKGAGSATVVDNALSSTSENPVQNKVITNALSGKADVDLSNLSINGQKVIDGSWVHSTLELSPEGTPLPVSNRIEYNLNELNYLPNDGLDYEISVDGSIKVDSSQTGSGASTLSVLSSGSNGMSSWICRISNAQTGESAGNVHFYITSEHILRVDSWGANKGTFRLVLRGYKRLGTNQ